MFFVIYFVTVKQYNNRHQLNEKSVESIPVLMPTTLILVPFFRVIKVSLFTILMIHILCHDCFS